MVCYSCQRGVGGVLAWVAREAYQRGLHGSASGGSVDGVLALVAFQRGWHGWRSNVGYVVGILAWVTCQRG